MKCMVNLLLHNLLNMFEKFRRKNNNEPMNSIAVWWDMNDNYKEGEVEVHLDVNIWHTNKSTDNYLEFGLKIKNYSMLEHIHIYIPYKINKEIIEDKAVILASNHSLTNAMFNERVKITKDDGRFHPVEFSSTSRSFTYYEIDRDEDIEIMQNSIIKLKINSKEGVDTIYYRFRINKIENIFTSISENYFLLDGIFKKTGFLEVNVNSLRKLPRKIVDKLDNIKFTSINLFIMTDNFTSLIFQSEKVNKSRILENHIWKQYLSEENSKKINKTIAYHWRKEEKKKNSEGIDEIIPFDDYNLFVKLSYTSKNLVLLGLMIISILIVGALGGVAGNFMTKGIDGLFVDNNVTIKICKENANFKQQGDQNGTK